ncbi:MAG TPA: Ig-like domain-containing protein, partial [Candidatus Acidoferrales bacterium]|nr:Ig-like domain-containing protein [Candidatus Acidoferrales bacterium]
MLFERISRGACGLLILCFFVHISSVLPEFRLSAQTKRAQESASILTPAPTPKDRQIGASAIHLPLFFEANEGQTDPRVRYLTRSNGYTMFLTPTETVLVEEKTVSSSGDKFDGLPASFRTEAKSSSQSVLRMKLLGANSAPKFQGLEELPGKVNYLIGKNPANWRTGVPLYSQVQVGKVYPGVDLLFHGDERQLEYDFIVSPGADPNQIGFKISGATKVEIDSDGDLVLHTASSDFRMRKPVIYQPDGSLRRAVEGSFVLNAKNQVTFDLGPYDRSRVLVIDPSINYATFLGGAETELSESLVVDSSTPGAPKVYVTGASDDITTFPEANTRIGNPTASINVYIAEIDPKKTGSGSLVYLSFIGGGTAFQAGAVCESEGVWLSLDESQGPSLVEPVIGGQTTCADYPGSVLNPITGSDTTAAIVTRLVPNGASIDHSVLLGGNKQMSNGFVFVDPSGDVLFTGPTQATNLPTTAGAYATSFNNGGTGAASGTSDCFTAKLRRSDLTPTYFSYLNVGAGNTGTGFSGNGCGGVIDSANGNIIYLGGNTESTVAFSGAAAGVLGFQPTFQGTQDAFLMKLDTSLSGAAELKFATYFGGGGTTGVQAGAVDLGSGIVSNSTGVVALAGHTTSNSTTNAPDIPISNAFSGQTTNAAASSTNQETGFFTIMDTTKSGSASLLCGSYFGGSSGFDVIRSLAFDPLVPFGYYIIVGGHTQSADFPVSNAFQTGLVGTQDGFVSGLMVNTGATPNAEIFFSSYIGAGGDEEITGIGLDTNHAIYATGTTTSASYFGNTSPATTVNGFQATCTSCGGTNAPQPDAVIFALTSAASASFKANIVATTQSLLVGNTEQLTVLGTFSDGTFQDLTSSATWTSSNTGVATISSSGLVTAV